MRGGSGSQGRRAPAGAAGRLGDRRVRTPAGFHPAPRQPAPRFTPAPLSHPGEGRGAVSVHRHAGPPPRAARAPGGRRRPATLHVGHTGPAGRAARHRPTPPTARRGLGAQQRHLGHTPPSAHPARSQFPCPVACDPSPHQGLRRFGSTALRRPAPTGPSSGRRGPCGPRALTPPPVRIQLSHHRTSSSVPDGQHAGEAQIQHLPQSANPKGPRE